MNQNHGLQTCALIFDLMGTCTNWSSSIVSELKAQPTAPGLDSEQALKSLAADWRAGFFKEIHYKFQSGAPFEDIDVTHRRVLDQLLLRDETFVELDVWDDVIRAKLVQSWHSQEAWPDAVQGIERLKKKYFVVVLANGTTRLQLDIVKSSQLPFHTLLSSQLLGMTKPHPQIYLKALTLLNLKPEECIMVAAHAYDLRAASKIGMRTAYIQRTTEDLDEDMEQVRKDCDLFIQGLDGSQVCGLNTLADVLNA